VILLTLGFDPTAHAFTQRWLLVSQIFPVDAQGMVQLQPQTIEQGQVSQQEVKISLGDLAEQLSACR
jgi:hypothetical protein